MNRIINKLVWLPSMRTIIPGSQLQHIFTSSRFTQDMPVPFPKYGDLTSMKEKGLGSAHRYSFSSTKLTKQEIKKSSYAELVDKITALYNFKQYKIPSALSLLEIHHQFKIFRPGDWVLDIGAGPNWAWTDLALKLTHTSNNSNRVISNDMMQCLTSKQQNINVTGNFLEEQIQTKIAMNLIDRQLNTILVDATPKYSGNQDIDSEYTLQVFIEALKFSEHYLKKGGTIVFKTVESALSLKNEKQAKFFFHEVYKYKSNNFRPDSPAFFYVLKGFMMTDNLQGLQKLYKQYSKAKTSGQKIQIVEKYKKKYTWDPIEMIINEAKEKICQLKNEGRKNKQIAAIYENDPYIKAAQIISLIDKIGDKKSHPATKIKARNQLLLGDKGGNITLPENKQQFVEALFSKIEEVDKQIKQEKEAKKRKKSKQKHQDVKKVQDRAPLGDTQLYLKSTKIVTGKEDMKNVESAEYLQEDLYGYHPDDPTQPINRKKAQDPKEKKRQDEEQFEKIIKSFPEVKEILQKNRTTFEEQVKKTQEILTKDFFANPEKQHKRKSMKPEIDLNEDLYKFHPNEYSSANNEEDEEDEQLLKTKSYHLNKKKYSNLDKKNVDYDFDFDDQQLQQISNELNEKEKDSIQDQQFDRQSKVEYLKSKPKKARIQKRSQNQGSYFKLKKRDIPQ